MFCQKCGTKVQSKGGVNKTADDINRTAGEIHNIAPDTSNKSVFCPKCRSKDVLPLSETETEVSGGGYGVGSGCCGWILLGPIGLLCGLCGRETKVNSKTRHFWICKSCEHKFRNAEDERAEEKALATSGFAISVIILIAGIIFAFNGTRFLWMPAWIYIAVGVLGTLLFSVGILMLSVIDMDEENVDKLDAVFEKLNHYRLKAVGSNSD